MTPKFIIIDGEFMSKSNHLKVIAGRAMRVAENPESLVFTVQRIGPRQFQAFVRERQELDWGGIALVWRPLPSSLSHTRAKAWAFVNYQLGMGYGNSQDIKGFALIGGAT